jgi:hypothetical protein
MENNIDMPLYQMIETSIQTIKKAADTFQMEIVMAEFEGDNFHIARPRRFMLVNRENAKLVRNTRSAEN